MTSLIGDLTMERQKVKYNVESYMNDLERRTNHTILNRDVGYISLDLEKAFFILLPLLNGEVWTEQMHTAAIAVGAVHVAFDAHDRIDLYHATSRKQQLTVLSGDYYSGIHYKLLASLSDFDFIRTLSNRIGSINEIKTIHHGRTPATSSVLIATVELIESGCIAEFFQAYGFSRYIPLIEAALPLLRLDAKQNSSKQPIHINQGWNKSETIIAQAIIELQNKLHKTIDEANFIDPLLKEQIRGMTIPVLGKSI